MNNRRTFEIELDFVKANQAPVTLGSVKQFDGTTIIVKALNGDKDKDKELDQMDLNDCVARLYAKKPTGEHVYQKDRFDIRQPNTITFYCADEIFSDVGIVQLEVEVIDLDGYIVTSPTLQIQVVDKINDLNDREVIYVQEIGLMEELKSYIEESSAYIETFKGMLDVITSPDYASLLEQLIATQQKLDTILPEIDDATLRLQGKIDEAEAVEIQIQTNEVEREVAELKRITSELDRIAAEEAREQKFLEWNQNQIDMDSAEQIRATAELERAEAESFRKAAETTRETEELIRAEREEGRVTNEMIREQNEVERRISMQLMREDITEVQEKVDGFQKDGNFEGDIVVKGNVYPTIDGVKPVHGGPPTKNAGNIIMPYARAIGGMTKDGSGVRTIGFVAKPKDASSDLDITEEQNTDAVFLGTNVSQMFLYSKEKYPTIVSQGELSPIATQDWVMRLVEGLGLLDKGLDDTPTVTTSVPSEFFDFDASEQWSTAPGEWLVNDAEGGVMLLNGQKGLYKPLFGIPSINELTYIKGGQIEGSTNDLFLGMWRTQNYIYGARISGNTLSLSYFGANGIRGGANSFTLRDEILPGDTVTMHYNFTNDIWEIYKFDANNEPILVYQMSKFMMSGFPEFLNGKNVSVNASVLINETGGFRLAECPNPDGIRGLSETANYIF